MILDHLTSSALQWTAVKEKIFRQNGEAIPDKMAVVRTDTNMYLGTVSRTYGLIQNQDCWPLITEALNTGAELIKAGEINGGHKVWWALRLGEFDIEKLQKYLIIVNAFDGSSRFKAMVTTIRPHCSNMLNRISRSAIMNISIKHTANAQFRVEQVQNLIDTANVEYAKLENEIKIMRSRRISHGEFEDYAKSVLKVRDEKRFGLVMSRLTANMSIDPYLGTMWGAYNAVTQYLEHQRPVRGNESEARFSNNLFGTVAKMKSDALRMALEN